MNVTTTTVNVKGSKTLADAKPLMHGGMNVTVNVESHTAQLVLCGTVAAVRNASEVETVGEMQAWAYQVIESGAPADRTEVTTNEELLTMVETRGGSNHTHGVDNSYLANTFTGKDMIAILDYWFSYGVDAEIRDGAASSGHGWYINIHTGGASYGQYFFNGH